MAGDFHPRFKDRIDPHAFKKDTTVHAGVADRSREPEDWKELSERLVARLVNIGIAYELDHVPLIDIYDDTTFRSQQCEKLNAELEFLAAVVDDAALGEVIQTLRDLLDGIAGTNQALMVSGN